MTTDRAFHHYVGEALADQLPYRKRYVLWGEQVCEWGIVLHMSQAAFFIGCAVGVDDADEANAMMSLAAGASDWAAAWASVVAALDERAATLDHATATFHDLFPEARGQAPKELGRLLAPHECASTMGQRVTTGLIFALRYTDLARRMLGSRTPGSVDIGVGGVKFIDASAYMSEDEAFAQARAMVASWKADAAATTS